MSASYSRESWIESLPDNIRPLVRKFPPGTKFNLHGRIVYLIAYDEDGVMGVTDIDPSENYALAVDSRIRVCECCRDKMESLMV